MVSPKECHAKIFQTFSSCSAPRHNVLGLLHDTKKKKKRKKITQQSYTSKGTKSSNVPRTYAKLINTRKNFCRTSVKFYDFVITSTNLQSDTGELYLSVNYLTKIMSSCAFSLYCHMVNYRKNIHCKVRRFHAINNVRNGQEYII